jgi:hypothetical protein
MAEKKPKFDQEAMDRVTDKVLAFRPKKAKAEKKEEPKDGEPTRKSNRRK